jgi:hypothetical protein
MFFAGVRSADFDVQWPYNLDQASARPFRRGLNWHTVHLRVGLSSGVEHAPRSALQWTQQSTLRANVARSEYYAAEGSRYGLKAASVGTQDCPQKCLRNKLRARYTLQKHALSDCPSPSLNCAFGEAADWASFTGICSAASCWVHQGQERYPSGTGLREPKRNFVGQHFWARGFFVNTVGRGEEAIRACIRNQEKEDQRLDQLNLWR